MHGHLPKNERVNEKALLHVLGYTQQRSTNQLGAQIHLGIGDAATEYDGFKHLALNHLLPPEQI